MKPDWNHIRSYLVNKNFQLPSTTEEIEKHHSQISYLVEQGLLTIVNKLGSKSTEYSRSVMAIELAELMENDALWERAEKELIDKLKELVTPKLLLEWLKKNKPSKSS